MGLTRGQDGKFQVQVSDPAATSWAAGAKPHQRQHNSAHQDSCYGKEAFCRGTDVVEPDVVQQDLLDNEGGHCLGQLAAHLHSAQAQRDDLCGQQEVDDL